MVHGGGDAIVEVHIKRITVKYSALYLNEAHLSLYCYLW